MIENVFRKINVGILIFLLILLPFSKSMGGSDFWDVSEDDWFYPFVTNAVNVFGLFSGYPDGSFRPYNDITRAEVATVLSRLFELDIQPCYVSPYPDVGVNDWFCPYVLAIKEAGYVDVSDGESFRPNDFAQRWEVITMLEKGIFNENGMLVEPCEDSPFYDVLPSYDFCPYVDAAKEQGVTAGYPDGTFHPFDSITRAEIATMMERVAEKRTSLKYALALDVGMNTWVLGMFAVERMLNEYPSSDSGVFTCDNYEGDDYYGTVWVSKISPTVYYVTFYNCSINNAFSLYNGELRITGFDPFFFESEVGVMEDITYVLPDGRVVLIKEGLLGRFSTYSDLSSIYIIFDNTNFTMSSLSGTVYINGEEFTISSSSGSGYVIFYHSFGDLNVNAYFSDETSFSTADFKISYYDDADLATYHPVELEGACIVNGMNVEW